MNTARFDPVQARPAHNGTILAMPVLPPGVPAPFGHAWGYIVHHGEMEGHRHPTEEIYVFQQGWGTVTVGDEEQRVKAGDVVEIPPDAWHIVRNDSDEPLLWFALWWEPVGDTDEAPRA